MKEVRKMLMQFNFSNYKSYLNETSFDLSATSLKDHPDNCIYSRSGEKYLKVAAVYGANASGKSNLLYAFEYMLYFVKTSFSSANERKLNPLSKFKYCDSGKNNTSTFEVFFENNGREYQYGFVLDEKMIYEEWLYKRDYRGKSKYVTLFERNKQKFNLSNKLDKLTNALEFVSEKVLLLSFLSNIKHEEISNVYEWFNETEVLDYGNTLFEHMIHRTIPSIDFSISEEKTHFENYLKAIDIDIDGVRLERVNKESEDEEPIYKFFSQRLNTDTGKIEELPLEHESSGTLKMISLYDYIKDSLNEGKVLFVDELDAKLHPLLTRYIINLFHNECTNKRGAQLIITTHDTNILKKDYFRRDQIWFCDKDPLKSTQLYSLAEYKMDNGKKVRNDASYDKDYLGGRYGALPVLKEFNVGDC